MRSSYYGDNWESLVSSEVLDIAIYKPIVNSRFKDWTRDLEFSYLNILKLKPEWK